MDWITFVSINFFVGIFIILVNFIFILCLIRPIQGEQVRQPLMLLLGTLVCCTASFEISALLQILNVNWMIKFSYVIFIFSLSTTTTSSVWLAFFYNTQIVPAKRAVYVWIKKNIKVVIYSIWLSEKMLCLFHLTVSMLYIFTTERYLVSVNSTLTLAFRSNELQNINNFYSVSSAMVGSHYFFCMCVMAMFNSSTVFYLCNHMRRMMVNGQPVFSPQLRSQLRVTVTCVLQGAMSICCTVLSIKKYVDQGFFGDAYSNFPLTHFTVIHLYMFGMSLCLGAGQAAFRQRAVNFWRRAFSCCTIRNSERGA